jgi:hypothetical protein
MAEVVPGRSGVPYQAKIRGCGESEGIDGHGTPCGHSERILVVVEAADDKKREHTITIRLDRDEAIELIANLASALALRDLQPRAFDIGEPI